MLAGSPPDWQLQTRQKPKDGAMERPFSRMHNFFSLEGDKWAKSGSIFRPKDLIRHFPLVCLPIQLATRPLAPMLLDSHNASAGFVMPFLCV